jgi:sigma-B regulation protein RsbU (phosphoserine phosphatase)
MGVARDFKIVRTVERLNRIIHQSRMTTKFVSLFYGEIEEEGNFIYVNAGHPPPLHFHAKGVTTLKQTGMVLGPSGNAAYSRGFLNFEKGDALLLYTDGMIEATDGKGKEFGIERLKKAFLGLREKPAAEITRALVDRIGEFTGGRPAEDDRTVVVVKYLTDGESRPADSSQRWSDGARVSDPTIRPPASSG